MSVLRQSATVLALAWLLGALQFLTSIVVARVLGPEGKGILALLAGVTAVLASLVVLGVPSGAAALYRKPGVSQRDVIGSAFALVAGSSLALLVAYAAGGEYVTRLLIEDRELAQLNVLWLTLAVVAVLPAALWALGEVLLIATNAMHAYAWRSAGAGSLTLALTWWLTVRQGWGVTGVLIAQVVGQASGVVGFIAWWRRQPPLRPWRVTRHMSGDLLRIGLQQHVLSLIAIIAKRIDVFLIATLLTIEDAGYYAVAILLPSMLAAIPRATMWPMATALAASGGKDLALMAQVSRLQVAMLGATTVLILPAIPWLVAFLFGDTFAPAAGPMRLAMLGVCAIPVTIGVNAYLTALQRPGLSIASAIVGTGAQVGITLVLIRRFGVSASAIAFSANFVITALVQLVIVRAQHGLSPKDMLLARRSDLRALQTAVGGRRGRV